MSVYNLISFLGLFGLMLCAWVFSTNRRLVNWRVIIWGTVLQLGFAAVVFRAPMAGPVFNWLNDAVIRLFSFASEGISFVFGAVAIPPGQPGSIGFVLAFQVLPSIIFFSALMALLYYVRLMPLIVKGFSIIFTRLMRVSGAESLCAASNIFVGIESTFTVRPYLEKMTLSELCTVLTAGMATIASTVLAFYTALLKDQFPTIAGHLMSASILSAPAAIVMAKLIIPETDKPLTMGTVVSASGLYEEGEAGTWIEAIIRGANEGLKLCFGIVVLLLAFLGLLAMVNWGVGWAGGQVGLEQLSLQKILGYVFYPLTYIMGVPGKDVPVVSELLGQRMIVTELVSYQQLAVYIKSGVLDQRSVVITAYALCGFAHIASLAIFVGGTSALVPSRTKDLARIGFRALIAATLACLMTGAVAGVFIA